MSSRNTTPKVIIVAPSAPPLGGGGVTSSHYHLYRCFIKKHIDTVLLTFNENTSGLVDADEVLRFGASSTEKSILALCSALYLKAIGSRKLAYQFFDILASVPGVLRMNRAIRKLKPTHIIIPDHCAPGLLLDKTGARLTLVAHHNPARFIDNPLVGDFCQIDVREAIALEQRVLRKIDNVIAPSRYMEGIFRETYCFNGPVATIHNPLDLSLIDHVSKYDLRNDLGLPEDAPIIYIPSAGSKLKGECFVKDIICRLAEFYNMPIGFYLSGTVTEDLSVQLRNIPSNIVIHAPGHLDYYDNIAHVKSCNFGISPTLIENFSMAILEAGFCGLPMVVFNVGGTSEIICDGKNGFCVPYLDIEKLTVAALRLLDLEYCAKMGAFAQKYARTCFDAESIVDSYLEFCGIKYHGQDVICHETN